MAEDKDYIKYLSKVHIEGYKSLDNTEVSLVPGLNIIIGPNGSGKSNFLEAVNIVLGNFTDNREFDFDRVNLELSTSSGKTIIWEVFKNYSIELKIDSNYVTLPGQYIYKLYINNELHTSEADGYIRIANPILSNDKYQTYQYDPFKTKYALFLFFMFNNGYGNSPTFAQVVYNLPENLTLLATPGTVENNETRITSVKSFVIISEDFYRGIRTDTENGQQISKETILKHLKFEPTLKFKLKTFSPIEDIRFSKNINIYKDEKSTRIENIYIEFKINGQWMSWERLSDGSKRLFYLIYSVHHAKGITLIEEPELGVHPHQFFKIMAFLKEEAEDKQIIIATHSPQALNVLNEKELGNIIVTNYDKKKGTLMRHLSAAEKKKAKTYMKDVGFLSDYWMYSPDLDEE